MRRPTRRVRMIHSSKPRGRHLLGDEAVALGALDAGISAAYAYPGTPSTEIFEFLRREARRYDVKAHWTANEKTAYEAALGVSMTGRRALVSMKHVGLNVATDPFVNSALLGIHGGLVVAVADDPSRHSSQNEQDSRILADFARVLCLEPADQQEAYDRVREAFDLSERLRMPVLVRLVTRLCHGRGPVVPCTPRPANPPVDRIAGRDWILLPENARRLWRELVDQQQELRDLADRRPGNRLDLGIAAVESPGEDAGDRDALAGLAEALGDPHRGLVTGDIGCYTLGALPPWELLQSCVCMGASIGMAKGAADAGQRPVLAVIGDSTFLHSGLTPLLDAVVHDTDMTVLILDNETVAMTGQQEPLLPSSRIVPVLRGLGVEPEHLHVVETHPTRTGELAEVLREAMEHRGLSVVVAIRECVESARRRKRAAREEAAVPAGADS